MSSLWVEIVSPYLPPTCPSSQALSTNKYSGPSIQGWVLGVRLAPASHLLSISSLTFVTFGSLRARWAWGSLQVESKRAGIWKPTTHTVQSARARKGSDQSSDGVRTPHLPAVKSPGRPCSPEEQTKRQQLVSLFSLSHPPPFLGLPKISDCWTGTHPLWAVPITHSHTPVPHTSALTHTLHLTHKHCTHTCSAHTCTVCTLHVQHA
jgi:hypothetical protein